MSKYANNVVQQAINWLGLKESDGSYKAILNIYNSQNPLPRGYKMTVNDPWCATFVSAVSLYLGYTDIIPTECSCTRMIEKLKKINSWVEDDAYVPAPGDLIFYDWEAPATGDAKSDVDHVGIVEKVEGSVITVIEGNYSNSVKRRKINVNHRYIRGYGVPKYESAPSVGPKTLRKGDEGEEVRELQRTLISLGYSVGDSGADGDFGANTEKAVKSFQGDRGLGKDGVVGAQTYAALEKAVVELEKKKSYSLEQFVRDVQGCLGVGVDGIAGPITFGATITVSRWKNKKHPVVKYIQKRLYALGYTEVGEADGEAGAKFDKAVKAFQKDKGCVVDGEATAKRETWKYLLGMA